MAFFSIRNIFNGVASRSQPFSTMLGGTLSSLRQQPIAFGLCQVRGFKNPKTKMKSKKAATKRFIATGNGNLKRGHAGKRHLTGHMSAKRTMRLNNKVFMTGTNLKNMKKLTMFK